MVTAEKTECVNGHSWIIDNIRQDSDLRWRCKLCEAAQKKAKRIEGRKACKRGHPWPENLATNETYGTHYCKACRALRNELRKDHRTLSGRESEVEPLPEAEPEQTCWGCFQLDRWDMKLSQGQRVAQLVKHWVVVHPTPTIIIPHESYKETLPALQTMLGEDITIRMPVHAKEPKPCNDSTFYLR